MREVDYKKYRGHITDVLNLRIWNMDNGRKVSEYLDLLRSQKVNIRMPFYLHSLSVNILLQVLLTFV